MKSQIKQRNFENDSLYNKGVPELSKVERDGQLGSEQLELFSRELVDGEEVLSGDEQTIDAGQSSVDNMPGSRGTALTDKWKALNADLFDMKFKVKSNDPPVYRNKIGNRIGAL